MNEEYYIDTCIWLNLFKKEGDAAKGKPYWRIARDFLILARDENKLLFYSGFVLNELKYKLKDRALFNKKLVFFRKLCRYITATEDDYLFARELEKIEELSFYDCIHIALAKRENLILVTRDKLLLENGKRYVKTRRPEELS